MKPFIYTALALYVILMTQASTKDEIIDFGEKKEEPKFYDAVAEIKLRPEDISIEMKEGKNDRATIINSNTTTLSTKDSETSKIDLKTSKIIYDQPKKQKYFNTAVEQWIHYKVNQEEFNKEYNNFKPEEKRNKFPLFVSYEWREPQSQMNDNGILYSLTEEQAIYLCMFSEFFKNQLEQGVDGNQTEHAGYCKETYTYTNDVSSQVKVAACQLVRSVKFTILNKIHRSTMEFVIDFVEHYQGIEPKTYKEETVNADAATVQNAGNAPNVQNAGNAPNVQNAGNPQNAGNTKKKLVEVRWVQKLDPANDFSLIFGFEDAASAVYPRQFIDNVYNNPNNFRKDGTDVSILALASSALQITTLEVLCGAKISSVSMKALRDRTYMDLAQIRFDEPWFLEEKKDK